MTRCAALFVLVALTAGCSTSPSSSPAAAPPAAARLWGDLRPIVSVKELMRDMIDPASDYVFNSVGTVISSRGIVETMPRTDEDWEKIRTGAVTLAEGVSLLKIPRPFAPSGDENASTGPDATEMTPAEITAKVEKDPVEWNARIEALRNVGLQVLDIVKTKDAKQLGDAAENLDTACENCHRSYWYPREDADFYKKLDARIKALSAPSPGGR